MRSAPRQPLIDTPSARFSTPHVCRATRVAYDAVDTRQKVRIRALGGRGRVVTVGAPTQGQSVSYLKQIISMFLMCYRSAVMWL